MQKRGLDCANCPCLSAPSHSTSRFVAARERDAGILLPQAVNSPSRRSRPDRIVLPHALVQCVTLDRWCRYPPLATRRAVLARCGGLGPSRSASVTTSGSIARASVRREIFGTVSAVHPLRCIGFRRRVKIATNQARVNGPLLCDVRQTLTRDRTPRRTQAGARHASSGKTGTTSEQGR